MIDHDRLFKELLTTFFLEFLELFFPPVLTYVEPGTLEFLNQEVFTDVTAGEKNYLDIIAKLRFRGQESYFLINVEPFADNRGQFGRRMFRYFARLFEKHTLPIYPILLLSFDTPLAAEPTVFEVNFPDLQVLQFNYRVVQLNQMNWRDFVNQPNPVASALMAKMRIAPSDRPRVKLECLRLLATLQLNPAKMQLISGFIDTYLRLSAEEEVVFQEQIQQLQPQEEEPVMEIVTSWMEQGIERGLQQGIERGLQQGIERGLQQGIERGLQQHALQVVMRLLPKKIGQPLDRSLEDRIRQLTLLQLETLTEALLDFNHVDDLQRWLESDRPLSSS